MISHVEAILVGTIAVILKGKKVYMCREIYGSGDGLLSGMAGLSLKLMQFGPIGWTELLLIILIALLLFGPRKLPELARSMGEAINEFRRASSGVTSPKEEEREEKPKKSSSEIRALALSLGIDVTGKTDEELMEEIRSLASKNKEKEE